MNLHTRSSGTDNHLLARLETSALADLDHHLVQVSFAVGATLHNVGDAITDICFPINGIASLQTIMRDGYAIDTAIVGRDGALGLTTAISPCRSPVRCVVRSAMSAFRISAHQFKLAAASNPAISDLVVQSSERLLHQTQMSAVRYARMSITARLAASLLEISSLLGSEEISITQESLAEMVAARRSSITAIVTELRSAGLIDSSRGSITILDRAGLSSLTKVSG